MGRFAQLASNYTKNIDSITISNQQFNYAKNKLGDKANIIVQDTEISKKYMIE
jgi:hypothetical protein